jgi:putative hemolysin
VKLTKTPSRFFATIQIGVTLAGFLASASAAQSFATPLANWLAGVTSINQATLNTLSTILITIILSFFTLVFGELIPKQVGVQKAEKLSFTFINILLFLHAIFKPFVFLLSSVTNGILKLFGISNDNSSSDVTEEEIRMMVDVGEESGEIDEVTGEMIDNVFEFDDCTVSEIMTHRTEIIGIECNSTVADLVNLAVTDGHSRIPVFEGTIDKIVGVVYVKDLLKYVGKNVKTPLKKLMREPIFVPEAKKAGELFTEMTSEKVQIAIVVDEYGGTAGLITLEDLVEFIVGDIQDEYDHEDDEIVEVNEDTFTIDATTDAIEVERQLGITLPEGDYDTLGGLILMTLGDLPEKDEHPTIELCGYSFTVTQLDEKRIISVLVKKLPKVDETEDKESEEK